MKKSVQRIPKWVEDAPQTPLEQKIKGKLYQHIVVCNASRRHPIGTKGSGCICLRMIGDLSL